ncbi:MAG: hypothetical protein R3277_09645 [Brumimicrobium sp.]|nr:hypothetical protein [Brumimicrobium sp.]
MLYLLNELYFNMKNLPLLLLRNLFSLISPLLIIIISFSTSIAQGEATLTPASTSPWIVPCGVNEITVHLWGGGGAGGGSTSTAGGGGGGASGCYVTQTIVVSPGQSFAFSVGTGGASGTGAGGAGGSTTFGAFTAAGGGGGSAGPSGAGGNATGGCDAENGSAGGINTGGAGGDATNGGAGGAPVSGAVNGNPGLAPGGGGGGGGIKGGGNRDGGAGGNGQIVIQWIPVSAGSDTTLATCATSFNLSASATTGGELGTWSVSPAGPTIANLNNASSGVTNLTLGTSYVFTWNVSEGSSGSGCTASTDQIIVNASFPEANAGFDQSLCQTSYVMEANTPETGFTGTWSVLSGAVTIAAGDNNNPSATINSTMTSGNCATLEWSVTNGTCSNSDVVQICNPVVCNDDPCGAVALPVNAACVNTAGTTVNATFTTNPSYPGCGGSTFSGNADIDVWYSATVPADGNVNITLSNNPTGTNYFSASVYEGPNCSDLTQVGCYTTVGTGNLDIQQTNLTPGSTIWIRVWYDLGAQATFNICATESANNSDVLPGTTTVNCGSTLSFYDTGGSTGNYANDQVVQYVICPSDPNQYVQINFTLIDMASSADHIVIIDGQSPNSPIIGDEYIGSATYTASQDGCLTVIFMSNSSSTDVGWIASVTCSPTPGTNDLNANCNEQNCLGGCMRTLCGIPSTVDFTGNGYDVQELNESTNGCWSAAERCSNWFLINPESPGTLSMNMYVNNGQDQDFAIWEGFQPTLACPSLSGEEPIMCNFAGPTSQGTGFNSNLSGSNPAYEDDIVITQQDIDDGIYFIIAVQTFSSGASCPQPTVSITFGGTAGLGCSSPVVPGISLDINLLEFNAEKTRHNYNYVYWKTIAERNNDYFTLEYSSDGFKWEEIGQIPGAGNSTDVLSYSFPHYDFENSINYYRLTQTDYDGSSETFDIVSVDNRSNKRIAGAYNLIGQEVNLSTFKGIVILQYEDGTTEKIFVK